MPEENTSSQNSQIPPNYPYFPYPPNYPHNPYPPNYPYNPYRPNYSSNPRATGMPFTSPTENEPFTPTFVRETQLSDRESLIELANLDKTDSGAAGRRKRSTWSKVEDEVLARSFVTISDDPIVGNDQKADAFWGRVASYYNENRTPGTPSRIASVIRSHWHNTIQKKSVDHLVSTKKARTSESGASNTSSNQDASLHVDLNEDETRPMGHKAAKRKGKGKMKSDIEGMTIWTICLQNLLSIQA
ncbi:uncharacterized protein LOC142515849 [Primulina tabacum]|uniref:uncharacterized protein LOC142515849 n=1 Tax=Primulina tabacum TaxID=48773 RepID=UPI003F5ACE00